MATPDSPAAARSSLATGITWTLAVAILASLAGCRICADCEDLAYPAYGGAWQRTVRDHGRVGSLFAPAGAKAMQLVERDQPDTVDEIVREAQQKRDAEADPDALPRDEAPPIEPELEDLREPNGETSPQPELERRLELDDIEVRIIPGRAPVLIDTQ